jgi:hypothetical protein
LSVGSSEQVQPNSGYHAPRIAEKPKDVRAGVQQPVGLSSGLLQLMREGLIDWREGDSREREASSHHCITKSEQWLGPADCIGRLRSSDTTCQQRRTEGGANQSKQFNSICIANLYD